jgi:hypothetical protein
MIPRAITRPLLGFLFSLLLLIAATLVAAAQAPATATAPAAASTDQALKPEALEALVAPIALYPDPLLALVLMASTYPLEVVQAERWVGDNKSLKDDKLKAAVDKQAWDDSVKGLVATPSVLEMMSSKLDWTQKLGDAVLAQQPDVMDAIQRLRARAQASNKLKSTPQQKVTVRQEPAGAEPGGPSRQVIAIEPAVADSVSVPYYDPGVVYGGWPYDDYPPYYFGYPGYVAAGVIATGVAFGAAYALRRWAGGNNIWGGGVNWGNRNIIANRPVNINNIGNNWTHNPAHRQGVRYGNAALGSVVGGESRPRSQAGGRPDIDHHAAALAAKHRHHRLAEQKQAFDVNREDAIEFGLGDVGDRLVDMRDAGIVDQDVQPSEGRERRLDGRVDILLAHDVAADGERALADPGRGCLGGALVEVEHSHARAFARKCLGHAGADAGTRAGDDRGFVGKTHGRPRGYARLGYLTSSSLDIQCPLMRLRRSRRDLRVLRP